VHCQVLVFLRKQDHLCYAVSGSARMALLADVPVICEDSTHFHDLKEAVELVRTETGTSAHCFE
jgi:hypothetical protein